MSSLRIAIIGGGPAGLTLARLLQINNTLCTVFELDTQAVSRDQGGTVDLHPRGGQLALKHAGLTDEFKKYSRPEGEAMKLLKYDGRVVFDENIEGNNRPEEYADRPEIDRMKLRQLLFQSLEPGTVVWAKKLQCVEKSKTNPGQYDLQFEDGREEGFDLVVGADGAWSKVRSYLTSQQPYYSGVTAIELWATEFDKKHQWLSDFVGAGNCFMFDEGRAIQCQKLGNNSIRVYAGVRQPESWLENCGIDWSQPEKARKELVKQYYADCGEDLKRAVLDANDKLVPRKMWTLPVGYRWKSEGRVTLIGDAAHLMTPYAGVGVNLAMIDSLDLAKAIIGCDGDSSNIPGAIKAFEDEMLTRAEQFAKKTYKGLIGHFSANGCEELLERLKGR
jgi:2-polyprenyl-6-methoxyphenol hydroxylase-like FAD-dependent oxidoreductase